MVAQGVGDFLTERAEQEVSAFATVELFARLCSTDNGKLMPKTCNLLAGQDNGATPIGLGLLKRSVERDLQQLPEHLLKTVYDRVQVELGDYDPNDPKDKLILGKLGEIADALCALDVGVAITQALRARTKLDDLITNPAAKGLAVLKGYAKLSAAAQCSPVWDRMEKAIDYAADSEAKAAAMELYLAISELNAAQNAADARAAREKVAQAAVALTKVMLKLAKDPKLTEHAVLLDELAELSVAIWNHDWVGVAASAASADTLGPLLLCRDPEEGCARDEKIRLLLSIGADIAEAKSSGDVQATLNRVAQPIGSWRRKHQDSWTFTLQGYAGGKLAHEWVQGNAASAMTAAPVLAIGLELSFALPVGRLGVFGQVVDVGNVASVRFAEQDDPNLTKVEATPDITWAQLFSPGAYLVYAPFKSPFVLGAGVDYVPVLRQTDTGPRSAWHVGGFLAVDVPILELGHQ